MKGPCLVIMNFTVQKCWGGLADRAGVGSRLKCHPLTPPPPPQVRWRAGQLPVHRPKTRIR
jgi:hypothetical protein